MARFPLPALSGDEKLRENQKVDDANTVIRKEICPFLCSLFS